MSDDTSDAASDANDATDDAADGFDTKQIRQLGAIMDKFDLTEIRLRRSTDSAEEQWTLRRGGQPVAAAPMMAAPPAMLPPAPPQVAAPGAAASAGGDATDAAPASSGKTINSPTVGTFYSKPSPEDPPFVKVGDTVTPTTTICLIEAMKVYNDIPAETSGKIARILVTDGDAVEFGQPLFELE